MNKMEPKKRIVIIGGGISGLTAGIFALRNGYDALIFEKNNSVGGLCTGWERKGWYIDGCIHWLTGTKEGYDTYNNWRTLGAFSSQEDLLYLPSWGAFEYEGTTVTYWCDLSKAEKEWLEISPKDKKHIKWFFKCVRKIASFEVPAEAPIPLFRFRSYFRFVWRLIKTFPHYIMSTKMTCEGFAKKFESKALQNALIKAQPGDGNLYSMALSYATVASGNGGIIKGGSRLMARRMGDKFISLGGDLRLNSPVKQIVVENKKVSKVILEDNSEITGDYFISCCESDYTCHTLLENKYVNKKLEKRFKDMERYPSPSCCLLHFVVKDMPKINVPLSFGVTPFSVAGRTIDTITVRDYSYDPTYVKDNQSILQVLLDQYSEHYAYWNQLYKNKENYINTKNKIANDVISRIIKRFPELEGKIELLDFVTPKTINRYVNTSFGNYMSHLFTARDFPMMIKGKLKGIKNFYLSSQSVEQPGGLPMALMSGKYSIMWIKYEEDNKFLRVFKRNKYYNLFNK